MIWPMDILVIYATRNATQNKKKYRKYGTFKEASTGFEPVDTGVADHCLTTWLRRRNDSDGNRTRVTAVKGRCLNRLTTEP